MESRSMIRKFLGARLVITVGLLTTMGLATTGTLAAAGDTRPDLTIAVGGAWDELDSSPTAQYVISVWNPGRDGEFDSQLKRWIVLPLGGPADNVTVLDMLAADTPVLSVSATNDFVCWPAGSVVTCRGGNVPKGGYAQILITVAMSARDRTATNSAVVDPSNAIAERSETNNTASTVGFGWIN